MCQLGTYENPLVILKNEIKDIYIYIYYRINNVNDKNDNSKDHVSFTALKKPNLLYISSTQSSGIFKGNLFLYFQFQDFKVF